MAGRLHIAGATRTQDVGNVSAESCKRLEQEPKRFRAIAVLCVRARMLLLVTGRHSIPVIKRAPQDACSAREVEGNESVRNDLAREGGGPTSASFCAASLRRSRRSGPSGRARMPCLAIMSLVSFSWRSSLQAAHHRRASRAEANERRSTGPCNCEAHASAR